MLLSLSVMAALPLLPMYSKAIIAAKEEEVLGYVLPIVALLSADSSAVFFDQKGLKAIFVSFFPFEKSKFFQSSPPK
jgi:hypothetical protein